MATFWNDSPFGNYAVSYAEAVLAVAGGYAQRDLSAFAKDCAPTYGNSAGSVGATTYIDGERSIALDLSMEETKNFTELLNTYLKNPTRENYEKIYANPHYAYHLRQRTKFTPQTAEVSVMFNDEAEFFARCAQRAGDVKTAGNTLVHMRNKRFVEALRAESVTRQKTDGYGITSDNDTEDTLPDACKTTYATDQFLTIDHLLELEGKVSLITDWMGPKVLLMHPKMRTLFLRNNVDTLANALFLPGNNVLRLADTGPVLAGFNAMTSEYCRLDEILIFEPGATVGCVKWFDRVKGGEVRETKWQKELLFQSVFQFKRIDDYRLHKVTFSALTTEADKDENKPGGTTGSVVYA